MARKLFDVALLKRVFRFAAPYRKQLYLSVLLAILLAVISPVRPYLIQLTVDKYISNGLLRMVVQITFIQIVLLIVESLMRFVFSYLTSWIGQTVVKDMRLAVYRKVVFQNLGFFDKTPIGTLTTRTINDIEAINDMFSDGLISIIADLLMIFSILGVMLYSDWKLTLISLSVFPILIIATYIFKESVNKSFFRVRNAIASLNAFVQEHITGMFVVQAFSAENLELKKFSRINKDLRKANIDAIFAYSVFFPVVEIISALAIGLLVWYGTVQVLHFHGSFGMIIGFVMYINMLFRPLRTLADKFNTLQMGMVASERVFKVLDSEDFMPNTGTVVAHKLNGDIAFDHVWFAYSGENFVLKDVNFHIKAGEVLAVVGHTGSGKTSMISILNRLYEANKGSIRIDGIDVKDYELESLRRNIGVVLQDVYLFSGSILENITLRNPSISRHQVEQAAKMIGLHDFIMQLPGNYEFDVRERGGMLSLGQRQLIAFIRALLYDPSVLILDEATSSIDTESEHLIQAATDRLMVNRTSIVIAHRLSTIQKANHILVLDKGEVVEFGTHTALLERKGFYYNLHKMQFKPAALPAL